MGTAACGGRGFRERTGVSGGRPIGAARCRQQSTAGAMPPPPPGPRTQSPDPTALTPAREAGTGTLGQCSRPLATSPNLRTDYAMKAVGQARLERKWRFHTCPIAAPPPGVFRIIKEGAPRAVRTLCEKSAVFQHRSVATGAPDAVLNGSCRLL